MKGASRAQLVEADDETVRDLRHNLSHRSISSLNRQKYQFRHVELLA